MKIRIINCTIILFAITTLLHATYHKIAHPDIDIGNGKMNVIDDIMLVGDTLGLKLIDISNPVDPIIVGYYYTNAQVRVVEIVENIAYIGNSLEGLLILDVSNPLDPQYISSYTEIPNITALTVSGNFVYIAAGILGLQIIEISDIYNPFLVGYYTTLNAKQIAYKDDVVFVANIYGGMNDNIQAFDVSDPTEPIEINYFFDFPTLSLKGIELVDTNLIILSNYEIYIYDISDPTDFELLATYATIYCSSMIIDGETAYLVCGYAGLKVLDISNLLQIETIGVLNSPRLISDVVVNNNIAFVRDYYTGLEIYDISDQFNPDIVGSTNLAYNLQTLSINDNLAYSAEAQSYLRIFDVGNPNFPYLANSYNLFYSSLYFTAEENFIYALVAGELYILSIADPLYPAYICSLELEHSNSNLAYFDEHIFIGGFSGYLTIINVENYFNPYFVAECETQGRIYDMVVTNSYVYIANYNGGLAIVDISNPSAPFLQQHLSSADYVYALEKKDNFLYLASSYNGVHVVDVLDPGNPVLLETLVNKPDSRFLAKPLIKDDLLIIEDKAWNELLFYDISNPGSPQFITSYIWNLSIADAEFYDDYLVVINRLSGILILDIASITSSENLTLQNVSLNLNNYPNPFNPTTTIEFNIEQNAEVEIEIYNIKGQKVRTLPVNSLADQLINSVTWNGDDENNEQVSSGIYFYKLKTGNKTLAAKKCLLLK